MTAVQTRQDAEQRVVLHNIDWETYERLLDAHLDSSAPRFTYDQGELEIMSPLVEHEDVNRAVEAIVLIVAEELGIEFRNLGSTTFKRRELQRGFEPDSCFYFENEAAVRGKRKLDLTVDPPPDLVIEVDLTHSSLNKLPLFGALGVPEVWRYREERLEIWLREGEGYVPSDRSRALPMVTATAMTDLVKASRDVSRLAWMKHAREWARGLQQ